MENETISKEVLDSLTEKLIEYNTSASDLQENLQTMNTSEEVAEKEVDKIIKKIQDFQNKMNEFFRLVENFNKEHPLVNDLFFKTLLMKQFIHEEKYELCSELK